MFRRFARQNGTFSILDQIATKVWDKTREIRMSAIIRGEVGDNQHASTLWHCIDKTLKIKKKTPRITHVFCRDSIIFCANLRSNMKKIDDLLLYIFVGFDIISKPVNLFYWKKNRFLVRRMVSEIIEAVQLKYNDIIYALIFLHHLSFIDCILWCLVISKYDM